MLQNLLSTETGQRVKRFLTFVKDDVIGFLILFAIAFVIVTAVYAALFIPLWILKGVYGLIGAVNFNMILSCVFGAFLLWVVVATVTMVCKWIVKNWEASDVRYGRGAGPELRETEEDAE
jgi:multidrug efflux pump subunit AcrB